MPNAIDALLVLQDRDRKIRQLTRELQDVPARKQQIEERLIHHRAELQQAHDDLKKKQGAIKQIEIDTEVARQKIYRYREQQNLIKTNQEYKALEHEIEVVQRQITAAEDRELALMEDLEAFRPRVAAAEKALADEEASVRQETAKLDERQRELEQELEAARTERQGKTEGIPDDWLARYERVMAHVGDSSVVPVDSGSCGGCHMNLPPQSVHDARRRDAMVSCTFCGRILYYAP